MLRAFDQIRAKRLAAKTADVHAFVLAYLHGVKTGRLPANGMDAGRRDLDIVAIPDQLPKKTFRNRATANVSCANKEDVFHQIDARETGRFNLGAKMLKSICQTVRITPSRGSTLSIRHAGGRRPGLISALLPEAGENKEKSDERCDDDDKQKKYT